MPIAIELLRIKVVSESNRRGDFSSSNGRKWTPSRVQTSMLFIIIRGDNKVLPYGRIEERSIPESFTQ